MAGIVEINLKLLWEDREMAEQKEMPAVSMSSTKKELLEAYEAAKERLQSMEKDLLNAEKARARLEKQAASSAADSQLQEDPLQRLQRLRSDIGRELTELAERFDSELDNYRKIQSALKAKQDELQTIYGVEAAASDLAALLDAQRAERERFERAVAEKRTAFEDEMKEARSEWNKEKAQTELVAKEQAEALKKQRQREKEEFEYAFAREKEQKKNGLEDELRALEKQLAEKRADFEKEYEERKTELDTREEVIVRREKEMAAVQKEAETFPKRLETAVQAAADEATKRLTREFAKDKALFEAKFDGEKNVLLSKIDALEKQLASQTAQLADSARRQEQAYEKVQDIANRAVASAKREVISIPAAQCTAHSREEGRGSRD